MQDPIFWTEGRKESSGVRTLGGKEGQGWFSLQPTRGLWQFVGGGWFSEARAGPLIPPHLHFALPVAEAEAAVFP